MTTIAIDVMGGDHGVTVTVPAALDTLKGHKNLNLVLVGDEKAIEEELKKAKVAVSSNLIIHHAPQVVGMDEPPAKALRGKRDSSMRLALDLVKEGKAAACVSAGNTGALMAMAHYVLKTLPGIDRPAIIGYLPTYDINKSVILLDLGANANSTAEDLYQFAVMGAVVASAHFNVEKPRVGLLNIGVEQIKGNELVKAASELLAKSEFFNYIGYVEGDSIFKGVADVVVCDGFVGNVALKAMEGVVHLIVHYAKTAFTRNIFSKIAALIAMPSLKYLKRQIEPAHRNGAGLVGLRGIVIKSHGWANRCSFANAIEEAILEVEKNVPQKIGEKVGKILGDNC
jgi:phosphate acyltransferase